MPYPQYSVLLCGSLAFLDRCFAHLIPQTDRTTDRQIPVVAVLDHRPATGQMVGYRYDYMPPDRVVYEIGIQAIDSEAEHCYGESLSRCRTLNRTWC